MILTTSMIIWLQEVEYAGIKFPNNLDTPHDVAQVLNQQPGKLRIKDLREGVQFQMFTHIVLI